MASVHAQKQAMRVVCRARRAAAARAAPDAGTAVRAVCRRNLRLPAAAVVAGYVPRDDEVDVLPLLTCLRGAGHEIALPRIAWSEAPLAFHAWVDGDGLGPGPFGTLQPLESAIEVVPDVLIVPLLAFDRRGFRLGYGGGYYDRTLTFLRGRRTITAIGAAFAAQEVPVVPSDEHDQPLDWIVTDFEAIRTGSED